MKATQMDNEHEGLFATMRTRGFLPAQDPVTEFPRDSELSLLDQLGRDLPSLLQDRGFRDYAKSLNIPPWPHDWPADEYLPFLRLYYVRIGFLASAYVNQTSEGVATLLPNNIAIALVKACELLQRPPILSYDGYALYNWKRFRKDQPLALGNIDTIQNFVHLYDEHWFILIHVEIEAIAADIIDGIAVCADALRNQDNHTLNRGLKQIADALWRQVAVLRRTREKMDPALYFKVFRPYIRYFHNVVYEGIDLKPMNQRGETGAQSSIMPVLVSFMKIPHRPTSLTNHLNDMRQYMPKEHREYIAYVDNMEDFRHQAEKDIYNDVLDAIATFRETHFHWANEYIHRPSKDITGTGGTPYIQWLKQLIDETRAHQL